MSLLRYFICFSAFCCLITNASAQLASFKNDVEFKNTLFEHLEYLSEKTASFKITNHNSASVSITGTFTLVIQSKGEEIIFDKNIALLLPPNGMSVLSFTVGSDPNSALMNFNLNDVSIATYDLKEEVQKGSHLPGFINLSELSPQSPVKISLDEIGTIDIYPQAYTKSFKQNEDYICFAVNTSSLNRKANLSIVYEVYYPNSLEVAKTEEVSIKTKKEKQIQGLSNSIQIIRPISIWLDDTEILITESAITLPDNYTLPEASKEEKEVLPAKESSTDLELKLTELKSLYDKGLISEEEYKAKKQELLNKL